MAVNNISVIIPCMGRANHVLQNLKNLQGLPAQTIVVDYSCPQFVGKSVKKQFPDVTVIEVPYKSFFNLSDARNAGLNQVLEDWVFFLDADIVLDASLFNNEKSFLSPEKYYILSRYRESGAYGSLLAPTDIVRELGGYDPRFNGYGGEDLDIFERLALNGLSCTYLSNQPIRILNHSIEARVENYEEKNRAKSSLVNRVYANLKIGIMKMQSKSVLPDVMLDNLRKFSEEKVREALIAGKRSVNIKVNLQPFAAKYCDEESELRRIASRNNVQCLEYHFRF